MKQAKDNHALGVLRSLSGLICVLSSFFFLLPAASGILHIGMLWPAVYLLTLGSMLIFPAYFYKIPSFFRKAIYLGMILWAIYAALISAFMSYFAAKKPPTSSPPSTVIILGCQVTQERPSLMLQDRINSAYIYLEKHPDSVCVASGGMDDNETITEAQCIKNTLVDLGISPERIYLEDQSTSTYENIQFSAELIKKEQFSSQVLIATDNFHEMRAIMFASKQDLDAYALGNHSYWFLAPGYWCREIIAISAMLVRGH